MSKVYLKDEATGVTVGTWPAGTALSVVTRGGDVHPYTAAEFRAVNEGGLRWMLENEGEPEAQLFFDRVVINWNREKSR